MPLSAYPENRSALRAIDLNTVSQFFPNATKISDPGEQPGFRYAENAGELLGYVTYSDLWAPIPAYSGKPIRVLIAIDRASHIVGTEVISHEELILVIGVTEQDLNRFTRQYDGLATDERTRIGGSDRPGYVEIDGISGATITTMVINGSIMQTARRTAELPLPQPTAVNLPDSNQKYPAAKRATELPANLEHNTQASSDVLSALPWHYQWQQHSIDLFILWLALLLLLFVLFFQDWLVGHTVLFQRLRIGYSLFTVVFIGIYSQAQLSIINMIAFFKIFFGAFSWNTLLLDPNVFVLWSFVALSILLWGRGVFCGWLCPFGALQELLHKIAERLRLPHYEFPSMVHERLWAIKYFILIALVGVSLESMTHAKAVQHSARFLLSNPPVRLSTTSVTTVLNARSPAGTIIAALPWQTNASEWIQENTKQQTLLPLKDILVDLHQGAPRPNI